MLFIKVSGRAEEKLGKDKVIERFNGSAMEACVRAIAIYDQKSFKRSYVMVAEPNQEPVFIYGAGGEKNYAGIQLPKPQDNLSIVSKILNLDALS